MCILTSRAIEMFFESPQICQNNDNNKASFILHISHVCWWLVTFRLVIFLFCTQYKCNIHRYRTVTIPELLDFVELIASDHVIPESHSDELDPHNLTSSTRDDIELFLHKN